MTKVGDSEKQGSVVVAEPRKRTSYTEAQNKNYVLEAIKGGNASKVAEKHRIAPNLLYRWKGQFEEELTRELESGKYDEHEATPEPVNNDGELRQLRAEKAKLRSMLSDYLIKEKLGT